MAKCPYTSGKIVQKTTLGTIIEENPEKNDNIFEVNEPISYLIQLNNIKTHTKKPISGIQVTIYNPKKKPTIKVTDANGKIVIKLDKPGTWYMSYYDIYQKRSVVTSLNAVEGAMIAPVIIPNPDTSGNASDDDTDDFSIEEGPKHIKKKSSFKRFITAFYAFITSLRGNTK